MMSPMSPAQPLAAPPTVAPPRFTIAATVEQVLVVASVFFVLAANRPFFAAALRGHEANTASTWGFVVAMATLLVAAALPTDGPGGQSLDAQAACSRC